MNVHVPASISEGLRRKQIDVLTAQDDSAGRMPDDDLVTRATDVRRVLLAQDAEFQPALKAEVKDVLGEPERGAWFEYAADPTSGWPNLLFHYQSYQPKGFDYLRSAAKLEFGSLTDQQPVGHYAITP